MNFSHKFNQVKAIFQFQTGLYNPSKKNIIT